MTERDMIEILLVEDNPTDLELTLRALRKNNIANHVAIANDGEDALNFLYARGKYTGRDTRYHPRVIFLDLKLPKVSGLDVARKLKQDEEMKSIPIVMLTSSTEECDVVESYRIGVNSYIVKPVDFDKFVQAVAELGLYWVILNRAPEV